MDHDEALDRLIDFLLREELGKEAPPNLTERILRAADKATRRRAPVRVSRWRIPGLLAATVALAVLCGLAIVHYRNREPEIAVIPVLPRGETMDSGETGRTIQLGVNGYCHVDLSPRTQVIRKGEEGAEELYLTRGTVQCEVDKKVGTFAVQSNVGTVTVTGTKFTVKVPEAKGGANMSVKKMVVRVITGAVILSGAFGELSLAADQEGGTVTGLVTSKGDNWIAVKADGQDEPTMYMPPWHGGTPKDGGTFDKDALEKVKAVAVGSKVRLAFKMDEHPRIASIEVLEKPPEVAIAHHENADKPREGEREKMRDGDKPREPEKKRAEAEKHGDGEKTGTLVGVVVNKGETWIEVKGEKDAEAQRYIPRYNRERGEGGLDKDMLRTFAKLKVNEWVKIEWMRDEHLRAVKVQTAPK